MMSIELGDSCDISIIAIVVDYSDNMIVYMQSYYCDIINLSMLCPKHE